MLAWKLRIVVLWISLAVCQSASLNLLLFQPGTVRDLMGGRLLGEDVHSTGVQVFTLLSWLVPMVMAYLTLVLKDADNRGANAALGGGSALYSITTLVPLQAGTPPVLLFLGVGGVLVPLLIFWHAWKWPHPDQVAPDQVPADQVPAEQVPADQVPAGPGEDGPGQEHRGQEDWGQEDRHR